MSVRIQAAVPADVPVILQLIRELAEFERLLHEVTATEEQLHQWLFGPQPKAEVVIARVEDEVAGFALYFHNFSTFLARHGIYLEDLYVRWAGYNFLRAYSRMLTRSGRRRMLYLMAGATAPALGSYPYLLYGSDIAARFPLAFWFSAVTINLLVAVLVITMAYAVAFFGVSWPDRVVKSRLFKWLLRGPVTASLALTVMTLVRRAGFVLQGEPYNAFVPFSVVVTVLLFEHAITLFSPIWEKLLFFGRDRAELQLLQNIEERLLTRSDLQQFLERVLAAVRDHLQSPCAFVAALDGGELSLSVVAGKRNILENENLDEALKVINRNDENERHEFLWGDFWILPLHQRKVTGDVDEFPPLLGLLGISCRFWTRWTYWRCGARSS